MRKFFFNLLWTILAIVIGVPILVAAAGVFGFAYIFGEWAVWIARIIIIIIIVKKLWDFIVG